MFVCVHSNFNKTFSYNCLVLVHLTTPERMRQLAAFKAHQQIHHERQESLKSRIPRSTNHLRTHNLH